QPLHVSTGTHIRHQIAVRWPADQPCAAPTRSPPRVMSLPRTVRPALRSGEGGADHKPSSQVGPCARLCGRAQGPTTYSFTRSMVATSDAWIRKTVPSRSTKSTDCPTVWKYSASTTRSLEKPLLTRNFAISVSYS